MDLTVWVGGTKTDAYMEEEVPSEELSPVGTSVLVTLAHIHMHTSGVRRQWHHEMQPSRAAPMVKALRALIVLPNDLRSVPSTFFWPPITAYM